MATEESAAEPDANRSPVVTWPMLWDGNQALRRGIAEDGGAELRLESVARWGVRMPNDEVLMSKE